jgi:hypothetical protein
MLLVMYHEPKCIESIVYTKLYRALTKYIFSYVWWIIYRNIRSSCLTSLCSISCHYFQDILARNTIIILDYRSFIRLQNLYVNEILPFSFISDFLALAHGKTRCIWLCPILLAYGLSIGNVFKFKPFSIDMSSK